MAWLSQCLGFHKVSSQADRPPSLILYHYVDESIDWPRSGQASSLPLRPLQSGPVCGPPINRPPVNQLPALVLLLLFCFEAGSGAGRNGLLPMLRTGWEAGRHRAGRHRHGRPVNLAFSVACMLLDLRALAIYCVICENIVCRQHLLFMTGGNDS